MSTLPFLKDCRFLSATTFSYHTISRMKHIFFLSVTGSELQGTVEEVENLRKEVDKLKHSGEKDFCESSSGSNRSTSILLTH